MGAVEWHRGPLSWGCLHHSGNRMPTALEGEIGILLEEVLNPVMTFMGGRFEPAFRVKHFRPVKTTDISVFTALLAPTPRVKEHV